MVKTYEEITALVRDTLVRAGSTFTEDKKEAYRRAIAAEAEAGCGAGAAAAAETGCGAGAAAAAETGCGADAAAEAEPGSSKAKWVLETILENAEAAGHDLSPLCDDTGIPHLVLEVGGECAVTGRMLEAIEQGVAEGLRKLPGRPMGIMGDDAHRIDQSGGLDPDSAGVKPAPILIRRCEEDVIRLHVLMFGGGPAIRGKTYRIFHRHSTQVVLDEIVEWAKEGVANLGCSPCTLAVGVGRSHFEAASMMLLAQVEGRHDVQSPMEEEITRRVNESGVGPLGLGGRTSVLATFMKVGPQRASGVRIVCVRPACCFEPRIASCEFGR